MGFWLFYCNLLKRVYKPTNKLGFLLWFLLSLSISHLNWIRLHSFFVSLTLLYSHHPSMEAMSNGVIGGRYSSRTWVISSSKPHEESPFHLGYLVKMPRNEKKKSKSKDFLPLVAHSMHHHQPDHLNFLNQQQIITTMMNHNKGSLETTAPMVFVIMGVSGSGKTTVGELLAKTMEFGFLDADDFHPVANIEKMSKGIPLNEEDRIPWLETLRDTLRTKINQISSSSNGTYDDVDDDKKRKAVLCCSALQKKVKFIYLETPIEVLLNRVNKRAAEGKHFMPASLLQSQLDLLQIDNEQEKDITVVDGTLPPQLIVNDIRSLIL
ncbi:hypothetical protein C5167_021484 [Papaver somniferum]|nr:hypothetical protein C5167_021484 [Papaver somniferum]